MTSQLIFFQDGVFLCNSPGCPGTHFIDQTGLELTYIPDAGINGMHHHKIKICLNTKVTFMEVFVAASHCFHVGFQSHVKLTARGWVL